MRDFTLNTFALLLSALKKRGYTFCTVRELLQTINTKQPDNNLTCILRHDVDRLPLNSLATARLENSLCIKGTYYFRIVEESFDDTIIKQIEALGHEIGYHYEDVDLAQKVLIKNGEIIHEDNLLTKAYDLFKLNLEKLQSVSQISTICMHGSPLSKYDNKLIWKKYNYKEIGILGEPYLDINWKLFGYLTDTGRRWDGEKYSVRDKVLNVTGKDLYFEPSHFTKNIYSNTFEIIADVINLPEKIMFTVHPQRWNNNFYRWTAELMSQNVKNLIKRYYLLKR